MSNSKEFIKTLDGYERTVLSRMARDSGIRISHGSLPNRSPRWISYEDYYDQIKDTFEFRIRVISLKLKVNVWQPITIQFLPMIRFVKARLKSYKKLIGMEES